jgi:phage-related protein
MKNILRSLLIATIIGITFEIATAFGQGNIQSGVDAYKYWLSLEAVVDSTTIVTFGRVGSQPYCEIKFRGKSPIRKYSMNVQQAFREATLQAYHLR